MFQFFKNPLFFVLSIILFSCFAVRLDSATRAKPHKRRVYVKVGLLALVIAFFSIIVSPNGAANSTMAVEEILGGEF